jgi:hypothetical protein
VSAKAALQGDADWLVGPRLQDVLRAALLSLSNRRFEENRRLVGRHSGERRCFVIGNGPSLKEMDLKPLADEYTIGANSFYKHPDADAVGLDYLCVFDPHFMQDEPRAVDWHRTLAGKMTRARFLLHESARAIVDRYGLYAGRELYYVRPGVATRRAASVNLDLSLPLNVGFTTGSSVAIPLALCLGFKEIYLIGFDCNWLEDTTKSYHFYDTHKHFPEFDSTAKDNRGNTYEDELRSVLREFESHRLLREKAEQIGVRIVNASRGGLLDIYEREPYDSLRPRG